MHNEDQELDMYPVLVTGNANGGSDRDGWLRVGYPLLMVGNVKGVKM